MEVSSGVVHAPIKHMQIQATIAAAVAAFQRGDLDGARRLAEEQLANPAQPSLLLHLMGLIECRAGRIDAALEWLKRASDANPGDIGIRTDYARLLADMGWIQEALVEIEEGSRLALAQVLADNRRNASNISSAHLAHLRELGLLLERSNQVDGLRQLLAATEKAGITRDALGSLWASMALREGRPEEAKRFLLQDRAYFDDAHWDRLMTKVADALGDADKAFAAAGAMNRAVPGYEEWRRRGAHYRAQIRATAQIVTPGWASRIPRASSDERVMDPAFVVGFPRSGTTLVDTFLMGHPKTAVIEEGRMLELATGVISESPNVDWPADLVVRARQTYIDELSRHVPPNFTGLVVDKHPMNMLRLAVLHALFPSAKVIFAQRHPCDVVLSGYMQSFRLNHAMASFLHLGDAADLYDATMVMWTRSREAVAQAIHTVVYERLTADPGAELRPALKFLGLDWHDELLDHQTTAKNRGLITTASFDQVVQPLSAVPSGRWRRYRKQLEPVLPILLPWAERLGYTD
jgi:tetratricopeptide (TPR) repeat protein